MRVVCDNCSATYRIPDHKLTKEVNKATCRKCGHRMLIQRPGLESAPAPEPQVPADEATVVSASNPLAASPEPVEPAPQDHWTGPDAPEAWSDAEAPTKVQTEPPPNVPTDQNPPMATPERAGAPAAPAVPAHAPAAPRVPVTAKPMVNQRAPKLPRPYKPKGDLTWVAVGAAISILGAVILAFNFTNNPFQSLLGLFATLLGSMGGLAILFTGSRGTRKASILLSGAGALLFALVGAGAIQAAVNLGQSVGRNVGAALQTVDDTNTLGKKTADDTLDELLATGDDAKTTPPQAETAKTAAATEKESQDATDEKPDAPPNEVIAPDLPADDGALDALAEEDDTEAAAAAAALALEQAAAKKKKEEEKKKKEEEKKKAEANSASSAKTDSDSSGGSKMATLPAAVVDTIVRNNSGVKKCFIAEKQRTGSFPSRVDVRFTVRPEGSVRSARVSTSAYRGSDLDACLGSAFRKLSFPAFQGGDKTITYPFIL